MAKITKVPDGPLIKKKGQFKGSTLKSGGKIKKAQEGIVTPPVTTPTPTLSYAELKAASQKANREAHERKSAEGDARRKSIFAASAARKGLSSEEYSKVLDKRSRQSDVPLSGLMTGSANSRGESKGSCSTGVRNTGESLKDNKRNGGPVKKAKSGTMIKRADGSKSKPGLWDNIRANKGSGKKPTAAMLKQEKKIKSKK